MASPDVAAPHDADEGAPEHGLPTLFQQYIHMTHYSRWRDEIARREYWSETVDRLVDWLEHRAALCGHKLSAKNKRLIRESIMAGDNLSSMRALMTAGEAAERDNAAIFNCTFVVIDDPRAFDETMYLLMCGTGVGFSVERQFIRKLPEVPDRLFPCDDVIVVDDDRKSWASAYRRLLAMLWAGHIPKWDVSRLRPAGARLKTFGGRSSGPTPLIELFRYTIDLFKGAQGRRLESIECHGIMCKIGDIVVSGGVRRSALISLSNPSDERMRDAKSGNWRDDPSREHFQLANNSAVWTEKPDVGRFMREWIALYESRSGERGIINRQALVAQCNAVGRATTYEDGMPIPFGVNPCGEIILRPQQMCNLTEIVARAGDTLKDLERKAVVATIIGTIQSTVTDFDYLRPIWKKNCDEERLLGVGITGELDNEVFADWDSPEATAWKEHLREVCRKTNAEWAKKLGIPVSAMITCQKPSGTGSKVVNSAPGGHARPHLFSIFRTRVHKLDPISDVMIASGVPHEEDAKKPENWVLEWPSKAPEGALVATDMSVIDQLERWLHTKRHYTEHNPSCTITIREPEWVSAGAWVYDHFDEIGGLAFFPEISMTGYTQVPIEEIDEEEYERRVEAMPDSINWEMLSLIEHEDRTTSARELACVAGSCDLTQ
jgi:ribonucleoside-triphosphate reductase